ncbi:Sir2 family NAD-dependent protein deacetylase [Archangium gephyra]|uniref:Sir2 family NAD-dependent protein deacetylase n=1 Tax=Archangium gephyra TaxID=48 RepID=UPI003084624B
MRLPQPQLLQALARRVLGHPQLRQRIAIGQLRARLHASSRDGCPQCGSVVRPEVVLFEELLPPEKVAVMEREFAQGFDLVFSIGTSSLFPYITAPVVEAVERQRPTVEINPGQTQLSRVVDVHLQVGAVAACEALWAARGRWKRG